MFKKKGIVSASILAGLAGILALFIVLLPKLQVSQDSQSFGSVTVGNEYNSTTTVSALKFIQNTNQPLLLKRGSGTLGSIVVASTTSLGNFTVYDGTYSTTTASSTIAIFPISAAAGTYTYDIVFNAGLIIDAPVAFNGLYTITYR